MKTYGATKAVNTLTLCELKAYEAHLGDGYESAIDAALMATESGRALVGEVYSSGPGTAAGWVVGLARAYIDLALRAPAHPDRRAFVMSCAADVETYSAMEERMKQRLKEGAK